MPTCDGRGGACSICWTGSAFLVLNFEPSLVAVSPIITDIIVRKQDAVLEKALIWKFAHALS